jgi:hypothetical protein
MKIDEGPYSPELISSPVNRISETKRRKTETWQLFEILGEDGLTMFQRAAHEF